MQLCGFAPAMLLSLRPVASNAWMQRSCDPGISACDRCLRLRIGWWAAEPLDQAGLVGGLPGADIDCPDCPNHKAALSCAVARENLIVVLLHCLVTGKQSCGLVRAGSVLGSVDSDDRVTSHMRGLRLSKVFIKLGANVLHG